MELPVDKKFDKEKIPNQQRVQAKIEFSCLGLNNPSETSNYQIPTLLYYTEKGKGEKKVKSNDRLGSSVAEANIGNASNF